jgi:hypothetical protein
MLVYRLNENLALYSLKINLTYSHRQTDPQQAA